MARTYAEKTIKLLFGAARRCAYPSCDAALVFEDRGVLTVVAEIAHIRSEKPKGPRYDSSYPNKLINSPENLLLLCGMHHKPVDEHSSIYPVDELLQWKAHQVSDGTLRDVSERDVLRIVKHYEIGQLGPEGFEKVCRALTARMFGPDPEPNWKRRSNRGYDAAFDGRAAEYPSAAAPWNGFVVVEALFNYNPLSEPGRLAHLAQRITKRFGWWFEPGTMPKRPDYVVIATNNSLAAARDGGASVLALLDDYSRKHDIKAVEFWDEGRITELLDTYPDVRDAVSAMTASHVLLGNLLGPNAVRP